MGAILELGHKGERVQAFQALRAMFLCAFIHSDIPQMSHPWPTWVQMSPVFLENVSGAPTNAKP